MQPLFMTFVVPRCKRVHRVSFSMFSAPVIVSRETDGTGKERKRNKCAFLVKPTTIATRKRMKVGNVHSCTKSNRISDAKTIFWVGELKQSSFLTFLAYVLHSFVRYYNPSYVYDSRGSFFPFTTSWDERLAWRNNHLLSPFQAFSWGCGGGGAEPP